MVFSSVLFLFAFLPLVLGVYHVLPKLWAKNIWLLLASLWFYSWGELRYLPLLLASIGLNYLAALAIASKPKGSRARGAFLAGAVTINLSLLVYYKYWTFLLTSLAPALQHLGFAGPIPQIPLPLGISFFTFHALSYVIDVARGQVQAQKNPLHLALYISLFPQLVAGPIVRYSHVAHELSIRKHSVEDTSYGVFRFTIGLAKKVLIANVVGAVADQCFALPPHELTAVHATLGALAYTLQIYFDFSGYSDMAIGLGRMFGFHFRENFDLPYWATSITDFWKRWHISLSSWFRDYLYVPLSGNQFWVPPWRAYSAMFTVFFLCGFWHGASWTFVTWGMLHGILLVIERAVLLKGLRRLPLAVQRTYALLLVMAGWVLFRANTFADASRYFRALARLGDWSMAGRLNLRGVINNEGWLALALGIVAATPLMRRMTNRLLVKQAEKPWIVSPVGVVAVASLLVVTAMKLASTSFNPFIYYRF
jgi:alginate O-acetyltransferase complex protein AlgI